MSSWVGINVVLKLEVLVLLNTNRSKEFELF